METMDVNCLFGSWPFRKLYRNRLEDLLKIHAETGIARCCVSSMNSIFYNDPFEAELDLHEALKGTSCMHILTVNPKLPSFEDDIAAGAERFGIRGVRIYPGYHGYALDDPCLERLLGVLRRFRLPLFLTMRLEDERLDYLLHPRRIGVPDELLRFVSSVTDLPVLILNLRWGEIQFCADALKTQENLFVDTSGVKDPVESMERIVGLIGDRKILYGSQYPLNALKSTLYEVTMADLPQESRDRILSENARAFFSSCGSRG